MLLRLDQAWYPPCRVINTGPRAGSKPLERDCHMSTSVPLRDESPFTNTLHANLFCTYFFLINQIMQITLKSFFFFFIRTLSTMKHNDNFKTLIYEPLKGILKDKEFFPDEFQLSDVISGFDSSPQKVTRNTLY